MSITASIPGGPVQLTGNPVYINCSGGSAPVNSSEYQIMLRVISADNVIPGAPFTDAVTPDTSGNAVFDISGYLDMPVTAAFQWPASGTGYVRPTQAFNVQVQVGERYIGSDDLLVETWGATSAVFQMLKGGLSPRQLTYMRDSGFTFYSKYLQGGKFLTARPQSEVIHPLQPLKLWFMPVANQTASLKIKGYFSDGSDTTTTTTINLNTDNLYELNCNPANHGHTLEPEGKRMLYFDVWIELLSVAISETRRFVFDWNYCERPVFMFFANTFGGVDDVYFSGYIKDMFATEGNTSYRPQQQTDTVFTPTLMQLDKSGQNRWSINTGWKSVTHIQYLRDLLISKQVWYMYTNITQTTTNPIPVFNLKTGELLIDRSQDLYSLDIQFSEAHQSRHSFDNRSF